MVERFNRTLLQLLRLYIVEQPEWEYYLQLVLYTYCSSVHSSTGVSPFQLTFGRHPINNEIRSDNKAHDPETYSGFFETNLASSAHRQSNQYNKNFRDCSFEVGDQVSLSVPTNGKLQPRWEGGWIVKSKKSTVNYEIIHGKRKRVYIYIVPISCLKHRIHATT